MTRWRRIVPYQWSSLPCAEACYVVKAAGVVVYVGHSFDLKRRMQKHNVRPNYTRDFITPWGPLYDVEIKVAYARKFGESLMIEARLIRKLKPQFNTRIKGMI